MALNACQSFTPPVPSCSRGSAAPRAGHDDVDAWFD
jgi:hypothetical protein